MCKFMIETCLLVLLFIVGRLLFTGYHDYTMNVWDTLKVRWLYYGNVYFIQWKLRYHRHWMIYLKRIKGKVQFLSITGWAAVSVLCPWQPHHLSRSIPRWDSSWHRKLGQHSESKLGINFFRTSISRKLGWHVETTSREVFTGHVVWNEPQFLTILSHPHLVKYTHRKWVQSCSNGEAVKWGV